MKRTHFPVISVARHKRYIINSIVAITGCFTYRSASTMEENVMGETTVSFRYRWNCHKDNDKGNSHNKSCITELLLI